jgi:hypothetical protein
VGSSVRVCAADGSAWRNEAVTKLTPGSILTSFDGRGFLGKITSIKRDHDNIVVETSIPSLREAFDELKIHADTGLDLVSAMPKAMRDKVLVEKAGVSAGKYGFSLAAAGDFNFGVDVQDGSTFSFRPRAKVDLDVGVLTGVDFGMNAGLDADLKLLTRLSAELNGSVTAEVDVIQAAIHRWMKRLGIDPATFRP